jgi:tetratricopeptide (TPR) repeat protein
VRPLLVLVILLTDSFALRSAYAEEASAAANAANARVAPPSNPTSELAPEQAPGAELYHQAEEAYAAGQLDRARELMQQALIASNRPELLYNLGELDRELGRCSVAVVEYRSYLRQTSAPQHELAAKRYLSELSQQCPDSPPKPVFAPAPPPTLQRSYWTTPKVVAWSLLGASVAAGTAAAYFTLSMRDTERDEEAFLAANAAVLPKDRIAWNPRGAALQARGEREQTLAWTSGILAAASAAAGVFILWRSAQTPELQGKAVSISLQPNGAIAGYSVAY